MRCTKYILMGIFIIVLVTVSLPSANCEDKDEWPMLGYDPAHTNYYPDDTTSTEILVWSYDFGDHVVGTPAVIDEQVIIASYSNLFSIDAFTGKKIWNTEIQLRTRAQQLGFESSPIISQEKIFILTWDNVEKLVWFDLDSGQQLGEYQIDDTYVSSVIAKDDRIYLSLGAHAGGKIRSLNADTMEILWEYDVDGGGPQIVLANEKIFFSSADVLYCVNAVDGELEWEYYSNSNIVSEPSVTSDKIVFGSETGVTCLEFNTGKKIWYFETGERMGCPSLTEHSVYIPSSSQGGLRVYCFDLLTGEIVWVKKTVASYGMHLAVAYDRVYVGASSLDAEYGEQIWSNQLLTPNDSPVIAYNRVYLATIGGLFCLPADTGSQGLAINGVSGFSDVIEGKIYVTTSRSRGLSSTISSVDSDSGEEYWETQLDGQAYGLPVFNGDRVYVVTSEDRINEGHIYCLDVETGSTLWHYENASRVIYSPLVVDDKLYVGLTTTLDFHSPLYEIFCLDAITGEYIWSYINENYRVTGAYGDMGAQGSPFSYDDYIYLISLADGVGYLSYSFDKDSGELVWSKNMLAYSTLSGYDEHLYISRANVDHTEISSIEAISGKKIWSLNVTTERHVFLNNLKIQDNILIAITDSRESEGMLLGINSTSGKMIYSMKASGFSLAGIIDGKAYVSKNIDFFYLENKYPPTFLCIDIKSGEVKWSMTGFVVREPIYKHNNMLYMIMDSTLFSIDERILNPDIEYKVVISDNDETKVLDPMLINGSETLVDVESEPITDPDPTSQGGLNKEDKNQVGISGFPHESTILGIVFSIFILITCARARSQ